ncbi:MAG: D-serine ammonia-lyase [Bacteroidetes bacterium]|nr:D-serine ammonia-lyase [Bacteroidota bacterium]MBS1541116.1 D-serine ammonia-lyase [Bacteroidota bacterium]
MNALKSTSEWISQYPALDAVVALQPTLWLNPDRAAMDKPLNLPLNENDLQQARAFMEKYAPYILQTFPEASSTGGRIISPLHEINTFRNYRNSHSQQLIAGRFFLKCDHALPVAGSIKARGGFYEVLYFAHQLAVKNNLIRENETADFSLPTFRSLFSRYTIGVGSTGNLGLSIGIISAQLGFQVNVYMSRDAKEWKKNLLRKKGAHVIEEPGDFGIAISKGRKETRDNPLGYFVDDENSRQLFLGYSVAAHEVQQQLKQLDIPVDKDHPLFVYSPCGVGGSPGGVLWGLKMMYGDNVHSFFVEPTHAPSVLTGLITGEMEKICVQDIGIDNHTEADGLAVGRPSAFATAITKKLVSGIYTIEDNTLFQLLKELYNTEKIFVEPSAAAGLIGPEKILSSDYLKKNHIDPTTVTHVAWSTGGNLMPEEVRKTFLTRE